ncbi:octaprenyl-diphosphate synthase [Thermoflexales bacterium]|nr:octaprenyl-diphosphate synthase [Thermoflexales bacterium]
MLATIAVFDLVKEDLQRVETRLHEIPLRSDLDLALVTEAIGHLLDAGGKRIRPALTLLTGRLYPADRDTLVSMAAAVEMLHTATLVHDDVVDGSMLRRGSPTLNARWSPGATILTGDYMFALAADLAAQTNSVRVMRIFARTLMTIVSGELRQLFGDATRRQTREDYFKRIYAKTASMFELATEAAGVLIGASEAEILALSQYGRDLGIAFQIIDDVLDFIGDASQVGKPVANDLRQGIVTLPVIDYLDTPAHDKRLDDLLRTGQHSDEVVLPIVAAVRASGAVDRAVNEARRYVRAAQQTLLNLPDNEARQSMLAVAEYVVARSY